MIIEAYASTDLESCIELLESNLDTFFDESERAQYIEYLNQEALNGRYFVAKENSQAVGAGGYGYHKGAFWLDWGMIHRSKHALGIGSKLLEFRIQKILQESPKPTIKLCTSQHTLGFYKRFGFRVTSVTKNGFGANLHKYELEKGT